MDNKTKDKKLGISYLLLGLTGAVGGHRFYVEENKGKAVAYIAVFWALFIFTIGFGSLVLLAYEAVTLPRRVLGVNGELDEEEDVPLKDKLIDMYKGNVYKNQLNKLHKKVEEQGLTEIWEIEDKKKEVLVQTKQLEEQVNKLKDESVYWQEVVEEESGGMFTRPEELYPSEYYKDELEYNRERQKQMKKDKTATIAKEWTVDGSKAEGKKFTNANVKKILRSFDNESDVKVKTLTFRNYQSKLKALRESFEQLNKINVSAGVELSQPYLALKEQELDLAYKGLVKEEEEKELLREEREREREEKKALQEINKKKKKVDKDLTHYDNMMRELQLKIEALEDENSKLELENELKELEDKKTEKEKEKDELAYREVHAKAGYVYIISNIGSFGKDVVKIGVTRRLNPEERIKELSSASVPFKYDTHALIFSQDAYQLESDLHKRFDDKRVNLVNNRKEFFRITPQEVKEVLEDYKNLTINFNEEPEALEYKETLRLANKK